MIPTWLILVEALALGEEVVACCSSSLSEGAESARAEQLGGIVCKRTGRSRRSGFD